MLWFVLIVTEWECCCSRSAIRNFSKPSAKFLKLHILVFFLDSFVCEIHVFTTAIPKISSIANNLRYHVTSFRRDVAYDATMPHFFLLYAKIAKGFSFSLRDQRCLTMNVLSTVDVCGSWPLTTDIENDYTHVDCCADLDGGVNGNSCVIVWL